MRATIDKAGRLVIPKPLRDRLGLAPGVVEVVADGTGLRVEPLAAESLEERQSRLVIPANWAWQHRLGPPGLIWRGELHDVDLGQPVGHEPAFLRPAVVVSVDAINNGPGELVAIVPVTSRRYGLRSHVELAPGRSGLDHVFYARCDQVRVISTHRLTSRRGVASPDQLQAIDQGLRFVLDL